MTRKLSSVIDFAGTMFVYSLFLGMSLSSVILETERRKSLVRPTQSLSECSKSVENPFSVPEDGTSKKTSRDFNHRRVWHINDDIVSQAPPSFTSLDGTLEAERDLNDNSFYSIYFMMSFKSLLFFYKALPVNIIISSFL